VTASPPERVGSRAAPEWLPRRASICRLCVAVGALLLAAAPAPVPAQQKAAPGVPVPDQQKAAPGPVRDQPRAAPGPVPRVAAASDLKFALDEIVSAFRQDTGRVVEPVYGSSGNLRRQIAQGAPFELFMSADEAFVFALADEQRTVDRGVLYAIGRLALFVPKGSPLKPDATLADLRAALRDGRLTRFAIANPEHAPYGRAAEQALRSQGLWDAIRPRLVLGENVSQAAQFAASGSAQGGIIAHSLVLAPQVGALGSHVLLPADWHAPLAQRMVLINGAGDGARAFYAYLQGPAARAILRSNGFALPGEAR
jgi:molybdate transport system substrate-binding protein